MIKDSVFRKGLVIGVIILFIGIAIQPSIATIQPSIASVQPEEEIDVEPKDYLFQTIIEIANNPDVKDLFEKYSHDLPTFDFDCKGVLSKFLAKNPISFFGLLFTKPSITYDYLDKCYNAGIELINILGEEQIYEMKESITATNTEFYDELNNIINNNEKLSNRLVILKEINSKPAFEVICDILLVLGIIPIFGVTIFGSLFNNLSEYPFWAALFSIPLAIFGSMLLIIVFFYGLFRCAYP